MADGITYAAARGWAREDPNGDTSVSRDASLLPTRSSGSAPAVIDAFVTDLCDAVQSGDAARRRGVVDELRAKGLCVDDIAEIYIPAAAHRLGRAWCEDQIGFAEVTIGSAHLQSVLRGLGGVWAGDGRNWQDAPTVLMIVQDCEHHTLGALVATGQMRRDGVSVRLCIGQPLPIVLDLVETCDFDVIMISAAGTERLETLGQLIQKIKSKTSRRVPVVVGGAVLGLSNDVAAITGADHITNTPQEALRLCGYKQFGQGARIGNLQVAPGKNR